MGRPLAPCGSFSAYKRHKRNGEPVDDACAQAARDQKNDRKHAAREKAAAVVRLTVEVAPAPPACLDELERLLWNLQHVEAAMATGTTTSMAALSKQHVELVRAIHRLEKADEPKESKLDELARRRAERLAAAAD